MGVDTSKLGPLGDPPARDYLRVLRSEFVRSIAPELTSSRTRGLLDMAGSLLTYLIAYEAAPSTVSAPGLEAELLDVIGAAKSPAQGSRAIELTRRVIGEQREFLAALQTAENGQAQTGSADATLSAALARPLAQYLTLKAGQAVEVRAISDSLGGFSKDIFIVDLAGAGRPADRVVVRRDTARGPVESRVVNEFAVLQAAHEAGVPVALPMWSESDPKILGAPFIVLSFVEGVSGMDFRSNVDERVAVDGLRQLAAALGRIHALDPRRAGIESQLAARPVSEHVRALIDQFDAQWRRRRAASIPVVAAALAWMRASIPQDSGESAAVVHGDVTMRNMMFREGRAQALLDWETWHVGDRHEDLAYCRDEIEGVMDWESFLHEYTNHGGRPVSAQRLQFWSMWKYLRGAITSISMMDGIAASPPADLRTAFGAMFYTRLCLQRVAEQLERYCEISLANAAAGSA